MRGVALPQRGGSGEDQLECAWWQGTACEQQWHKQQRYSLILHANPCSHRQFWNQCSVSNPDLHLSTLLFSWVYQDSCHNSSHPIFLQPCLRKERKKKTSLPSFSSGSIFISKTSLGDFLSPGRQKWVTHPSLNQSAASGNGVAT